VGIAYDMTELLTGTILKPQDLPKHLHLDRFPAVALIMTVCDDIFLSTIERLKLQIYPNCHIFILDDSNDPSNQALVDQLAAQSGYSVVRRDPRQGFKAGNLNHWLTHFGSAYKYLVVFDTDSRADADFITRLVDYAEHPKNENIAIFQSKVFSWNTHRLFTRILAVTAPARMNILKRTADQMGTLFAFGHNYLARIDHILDIGGFPENVTAEDTALTLLLSARGYSVRLVDLISYDTEPQDPLLYAQRTIRWAKQTVEMFRFPWPGASIRLKLVLCYHLYSYSINFVYFFLLLLSAWAFQAQGWTWNEFIAYIVVTSFYLTPAFIVLSSAALLWIFQLLLRTILALFTGASLKDIVLHSLIVTPLTYSFVFRMVFDMARTAFGAKVIFQPTNNQQSMPRPLSFFDFVAYMKIPIFYSFLILLGVILRNRYLLYGPNGVWLLLLLAAPLILWLVQMKSSPKNLEVPNPGVYGVKQ
jgi:cellulose synthase/poly-beta-1,6-N-acetylglucosamine synthase-like glycosyltransferase